MKCTCHVKGYERLAGSTHVALCGLRACKLPSCSPLQSARWLLQEDVEWAEQQLADARYKLGESEKLTREIQRRLAVLRDGLAMPAPSAWRRKRARSSRAREPIPPAEQ